MTPKPVKDLECLNFLRFIYYLSPKGREFHLRLKRIFPDRSITFIMSTSIRTHRGCWCMTIGCQQSCMEDKLVACRRWLWLRRSLRQRCSPNRKCCRGRCRSIFDGPCRSVCRGKLVAFQRLICSSIGFQLRFRNPNRILRYWHL